ncbi:hypothetical protein NUU61_009520 [Penicillium alfredii]|uniref:Amino acid permease/ SLC12A domain-containing protein n=1 Tax=Penicillium alfredii TaxID=1506179 RepID=A0A9W9ENJ1_9EURO|nr:uncharacterized protein NUU61_009520 [Penicillium alfredii]KAJ5084941.1 hypothetical protein NUU61_009520 [Penicillium alfredii]
MASHDASAVQPDIKNALHTKQADIEQGHVPESNPGELKRKLKSRHLQMIAIGKVSKRKQNTSNLTWPGLFISSGTAIAYSGPAGALIAYIFVGTIVYSVMSSLGEVATYIPIPGAFTSYAARLIDPSLGFSMGWIYWFNWASTFAVELTATGTIIQYWDPTLNIAIFIGVFWVLITALNFLPVNFYGELEFWFSTIKVATVIGFMIFAICVDCGVGRQGYLGFQNWKQPGAFATHIIDDPPSVGKFIGFWTVLIQAGFSYQGTELVGVAAGETENPQKTVPSAIRKTFIRILLFFVLTIFFIGLVVPSDHDHLATATTNASSSPMVIAAKLAGVKVLPSLINAVLLTVVLSAANSNVYSGSRVLTGLAHEGFAPPCFAWVTQQGVPYVSVSFTAAFGLLGFMNVSNQAGQVFNWLVNLSSVAGFVTWSSINACHIAFMRALAARGISRDTLPYKAILQPYLAWYGLFFNVLIALTQGFGSFIPHFRASDFFVAYICPIVFVVLYVTHKVIVRPQFVRASEADIDTGRLHYEKDVTPPKSWYWRVWGWVTK